MSENAQIRFLERGQEDTLAELSTYSGRCHLASHRRPAHQHVQIVTGVDAENYWLHAVVPHGRRHIAGSSTLSADPSRADSSEAVPG